MAGYTVVKTTIPAGETLSGPVDCSAGLLMIILPGEWEPASISFQVSVDEKEWHDYCMPDGRELEIAVQTNAAVNVGPLFQRSIPLLRIRSGTCSRTAPMPQSSAREFGLVLAVPAAEAK